MKIRIPAGRNDLRIKKSHRVLEVGSGHNPTYRANVLVDKYPDSNYHRGNDLKIYSHQTFVSADGEDMPFKDNEFDYVICNQVLEHVEDPDKFMKELTRVAKRGYIETPSILGEFLFPKESHKWIVLLIDNKLVMYEKERMPGDYLKNYGELFLNYLPYQSLPYKMLKVSEPNLLINHYEWTGGIDYIINPEDDFYRSFFTKKWDRKMTETLFPPRNTFQEIGRVIKASYFLVKDKIIQKKIGSKRTITIEEYMKRRETGNTQNKDKTTEQ